MELVFGILADYVAQLAEHWASTPKVLTSISNVVRHIFQPARCGYKLTPQTSFSPKYIVSINT